MPTEKLRALGYQLLENGSADEIRTGRRLLESLAERQNLRLGKVYTDPAAALPGLSSLMAAVAADPVAFVLVPTMDHLSPWQRVRSGLGEELALVGDTTVLDVESWSLRLRLAEGRGRWKREGLNRPR